ncbi:MAG: M48 family metallopeptidase [Tenacibaculum sp.]|nr:M48 family metallopeptidase [Tenacibaculum sp.]
MKIVGVSIWLILLFVTFGLIFLWAVPIILTTWIFSLYFKAVIYGDSVKVTSKQYPQIHNIVVEHCDKLNIPNPPDVFIYNGNGLINAAAIKFLSSKYVILMSDLVDLMLERDKLNELSTIIGHELGHHAAGHTNFWKNLLIKPAHIVPFLGSAYSRACELTADRIGLALTNDLQASENALVAIALGCESLANDTNIDEFLLQEKEIPELMGFVHKMFSSHPRMTKRVMQIRHFNKIQNYN